MEVTAILDPNPGFERKRKIRSEVGGKLLFVLLLMLCSAQSFAEYVDLNTILEKTDATLFYNPLFESGMIEASGSVVTFRLGCDWIIYDWKEKSGTDKWTRGTDGRILVPDDTSRELIGFFGKKAAEKEGAPRIQAIILDPGHGGMDPGANYTYTVKGKKRELSEKDITLEIALLLNSMLAEKYPDKKTILTRMTDEYKKLEERVEIANSMKTGRHEAVIYVSIHVNAAFNRKARGYQVWYLPDDYRRSLIDDKNVKAEEKEILPILNTMLEEEYTMESVTLAKEILSGINASVGDVTENLGIKAESWFVVRNAKMPSVLIETGFLSNEDEALALTDSAYLKKVALGIYNGLSGFISQFEHTKGFTE